MRFLDFLVSDAIRIDFDGIAVRVPHPANFALHKLLVAPRRKSEKTERDRAQAVQVLQALMKAGEANTVRNRFHAMSVKWQRTVRHALADLKEGAILGAIT